MGTCIWENSQLNHIDNGVFRPSPMLCVNLAISNFVGAPLHPSVGLPHCYTSMLTATAGCPTVYSGLADIQSAISVTGSLL